MLPNDLSSKSMSLIEDAGFHGRWRDGWRKNWLRVGLGLLLATALTILLTAMLLLLHANASTSGIVYLVVVVWFSTIVGPGPSIYLAVVSALLFDYYFLEPRYSLSIAGFQDILSMSSFIFACIVASRVADRARRQTQKAEQRREDVERLNTLSQEMMLHEDAAGLVREIPRLVEKNFSLAVVLLYVRDEDKLYSSLPGRSSMSHNAASQGQNGTDRMRDVLRTASTAPEAHIELLEGYFPINLVFGMKSVGTLAWKPATLSREVATSIAAQVAIAITRAHAIEASAQLEAARSADRLRSALIDSLTHELRTPLTAIRAAATTLVDGGGLDAETRTELATVVAEESFRLDSLIGEAMEIAEIESDGIRVHPEPVHVETFLEQVVQESQASLAAHRVSIVVESGEGPVWFDPHLIGRVFRHLLENAAQYTPAGSKVILRSRRDSGNLEFLVEDNGPGIDPRDLPLIFEKFYRGKQRSTTTKGSGMGLAITRALLAAHGGVIDVQSRQGQGTKFRVQIPLMQKSPAETIANTSEQL